MRVFIRTWAHRPADFVGVSVAEFSKRFDNSGKYAFKTIQNVLNVKKSLSIPEWSKLYNVFASPGFSYQAISVIMKNDCGLEEARKLKSSLQLNNPLSPITKAQMLRAYGFFASECTELDLKFIKDTVDEILSKFPVLTSELCSYLLMGLTADPSWKDRADIIIDRTQEIKHPILCLYSKIAFEHEEFDLGWSTIEKIKNIGPNISPSLYNCIVKLNELYPKENLVYKLLDFLEKNSFMITSHAAEHLSHILNSDKYVARFTEINFRGHCSCCKRKLEKHSLTMEEHQKLLSGVEERFNLNCKFNSYELEEVNLFKDFLKKCPPFTIVVDGLNLFYRFPDTQILSKAITKLEKGGQKMLVICRSQLQNKKTFCDVFKGHMMYFLNNRTKDDTFTIYSALYSGQNTYLMSNDFFGLYYSSLRGENRILFRKWQLTNQMVGTGFNSLNFILPTFSPVLQKTEDGRVIHVPLVTDEHYQAYSPYAWLCIQQVSEEEKRKASRTWPHRPFIHEPLVKGADAFKMHANIVKEKYQNKRELNRTSAVYY